MKGTVSLFVGLAVLVVIAGALVLAWVLPELTWQGFVHEIQQHATLAFQPPAWGFLLRALGVMAIVAVALRLVGFSPAEKRRAEQAFEPLEEDNTVKETLGEIWRRIELCADQEEPDVIGLVNELMRGAVALHASDVHISPTGEEVRLSYRAFGVLHEVGSLPAFFGPLLATRIKVMAHLDTYVRQVPQDGRMTIPLAGGAIDARVSTLPAEGGERIVLRLVRGSQALRDLFGLGLPVGVEAGLAELLERTEGLLFVCGPVGSGKTTTLYAALSHIAASRPRTATLVTIEDPVEVELDFATQTQINQRKQLTFARSLRSVLRQDPNVLMIGEIRDRETAEIAVQAGLTGHLILTTVHADSAAGPFARLSEMGVASYVLASASLGSLSQRLVRALCPECRRRAEPSPEVLARFGKRGLALPEGEYAEPVGCERCDHEGYQGQLPIAELLVVTPALKRAIHGNEPTQALQEQAVREGMVPLLASGVERARLGQTSLAEVLRVSG